MRCLFFFLLTLSILCTGCDTRREQGLQQKETELTQKEQELMIREQAVQIKEEELAKKEKILDSSSIAADTLTDLHQNLPGLWNVTMRCKETTCSGSAVGDIKTEQWEISIQNNTVIVKAMSNKTLLRIYSGTYVGNSFELSVHQGYASVQQTAKMIVRLQPAKENEMTGQREIIRPNDCRIIYDLELRKQQ